MIFQLQAFHYVPLNDDNESYRFCSNTIVARGDRDAMHSLRGVITDGYLAGGRYVTYSQSGNVIVDTPDYSHRTILSVVRIA